MQNITPEKLYKQIGQNVAKYRKEKSLSQLDLYLAMGYKICFSCIWCRDILQWQTFQYRTPIKNISNFKSRYI
ncbi:hypothetical protein [Aliarcobacter butzleri]|uniref:hypothetical protein n=1 Tax=Aliarcobacter butzleri TaxID=28197 RepID=UPI002B245508|nr:hypothetical protein [Aliarcobacter butzleri]